MKIFIVYAHPSEGSFTAHMRDSFIAGLAEAEHSYVISDLYKMNFTTDMSESEYFRETNLRADLPVPPDVVAEHEKINASDAIVFIYPLFWADAPAKLKGWFDRVWTYGFAYGENRTMKTLEKGLVICVAGNSAETLQESGQAETVKSAMLTDRIFDRAKSKELILLDSTSTYNPAQRKINWDAHAARVHNAAISLI